MPHPSPWRWIPTLYFIQGLPFAVAMKVSEVMYKNLDVSNAQIALLTSWLYLPWVIKPLWSPLIDLLGKKRGWIVATQLLVGAALALVALSLPGPRFLAYSLAVFWLIAFASATHDIAADGFYMLALPGEREQAAFVGVRSLFYRLAMLGGQGGLVGLAGWLHERDGSFVNAWVVVMGLLAVVFVGVAVLHYLVLPRPVADRAAAAPPDQAAGFGPSLRALASEFTRVFAAFFRRKDIVRLLTFLLLYRFAEAQLLKLVAPFLLDPLAKGGLELSTKNLGFAYGTVGVAALTCGGLLGGWVISKVGLRRALWPLVLAMHLPNTLFVLLAMWQPQQLAWVSAAIALEQFGYGFGFTAYMVFMLQVAGRSGTAPEPLADNPHKTAHYAICTGFMALGMMLPGMAAGWLQERLGYSAFFVWCCIATLPSFLAVAWVYKGLEKNVRAKDKT
jgi:MFS transporter, PAT family, beta-lactamase induction signal transducer AmpG